MMKIWDIIMQRQITKENSKGIWDYIFWDAANTMLYISPGMLEWIIEHATSSILSSQKPPSEGFFASERVFGGQHNGYEVFPDFWWLSRVLVTKRACRLLFVSSITATSRRPPPYQLKNALDPINFWRKVKKFKLFQIDTVICIASIKFSKTARLIFDFFSKGFP